MGRKRKIENFHLPQFVYFVKNRGCYLFRDKSIGKSYVIGNSEREMWENYARITGNRKRDVQENWAGALIRTVKKNARARGIIVDIDRDWILDQFLKLDGRCAVSGIPFSFGKDNRYRRRPWIPSVDRIDSSKHYTKDNCRLVCSAANYAMNEWDDNVLVELARGIVRLNRSSEF